MLEVVKSDLRVRKSRNKDTWECINVIMYSDGSVTRTVLCERATKEEALEVISK